MADLWTRLSTTGHHCLWAGPRRPPHSLQRDRPIAGLEKTAKFTPSPSTERTTLEVVTRLWDGVQFGIGIALCLGQRSRDAPGVVSGKSGTCRPRRTASGRQPHPGPHAAGSDPSDRLHTKKCSNPPGLSSPGPTSRRLLRRWSAHPLNDHRRGLPLQIQQAACSMRRMAPQAAAPSVAGVRWPSKAPALKSMPEFALGENSYVNLCHSRYPAASEIRVAPPLAPAP